MNDTPFHTYLRDIALGIIHERPSERLRIDRGLVLALNGAVLHDAGGGYQVRSGTDAEVVYGFDAEGCQCPDRPKAPNGACKHFWAVYLTFMAEQTLRRTESDDVADQ